jgi:hypothetical protein
MAARFRHSIQGVVSQYRNDWHKGKPALYDLHTGLVVEMGPIGGLESEGFVEGEEVTVTVTIRSNGKVNPEAWLAREVSERKEIARYRREKGLPDPRYRRELARIRRRAREAMEATGYG